MLALTRLCRGECIIPHPHKGSQRDLPPKSSQYGTLWPTIPYNIENSWLIQPYLPWRNWQRVVNGELGVVLFHGVNEGPPRKKPRCSATDTMEITIKVGDTVVSSISGTLSGGNHQAHDE